MQAFTEIAPPTAVTHAITTAFIDEGSTNLIIAKTTLLQVFSVKTSAQQQHRSQLTNGQGTTSSHGSLNGSASNEEKRLALIGEFALAGTIVGFASVDLAHSKSGGRTLLVALKDAKFSLVQWDSQIHGLATISVHYFEKQDELGAPWMNDLSQYQSHLTVDPQHRCAAFLYGQRNFAVLPFLQGDDVMVEDADSVAEDPSKFKKGGRAPAVEKMYTAFGSSFTLSSTLLDDALCEPIDICFMYEYREPTLGVLAQSSSPVDPSLCKAKDSVTYQAFTLDLEQRARTPLFSVRGLPNDIFKVQPLPLPVGGSLLVGRNELVHIDQSGKSHAIAVNKLASQYTVYPMADESKLNLNLDGCVLQRITAHSNNMIVVLETGDLAVLQFRMEGRAIGGIAIHKVPLERGGSLIGGAASCATLLKPNNIFIGCSQADSVLLTCGSKIAKLSHKRNHAEMLASDTEEDSLGDDEFDEMDELYGDTMTKKKKTTATGKDISPDDIKFSVVDYLPNFAALGPPLFGRRRRSSRDTYGSIKSEMKSDMEFVLPTGCVRSGSLAFLRREVELRRTRHNVTIKEARRTFSVATRPGSPQEAMEAAKVARPPGPTRGVTDQFLIVDHTEAGDLKSSVHSLTSSGVDGVAQVADSEFENEAETLYAGTLAGGSRIVQVSPTELRSYDQSFSLSEIMPMADDDTDQELTIVGASFCDPFILLVRNDFSVQLLRMDNKGELKELERDGAFLSKEWISGSLHHWGVSDGEFTVYLLNKRRTLHIFTTSNLSKAIYVADDICSLPPTLTQSHSRRAANAAALVEILVADLGPVDYSSPYLIIRTEHDDVEVYEPFHSPPSKSGYLKPEALRWQKRPCSTSSGVEPEEDLDIDSSKPLLRHVPDLGGYSAVLVDTYPTRFVFKESHSDVRVLYGADDGSFHRSGLNFDDCPHGLVAIDSSDNLRFETMPQGTTYGDLGAPVDRVQLQREAQDIAYHAPSDRYVIACSEPADLDALQDSEAGEVEDIQDAASKIQSTNDSVQLLDPETWTITDEYKLPIDFEQITCLCAASLAISEKTRRRRTFIAVGTSQAVGEDGRALGSVYMFDVIRVAPDPERKRTDFKLKLVVQEEVRGAVTALSEIDIHGLLLVAMGQKTQVRGLTDVSTLLPVAFMDVEEDVTALKTLKGTDLFLIGDIGKGLWFGGFQADPYKMTLFGRSRTELSVVAAEFLPFGKQLLCAVADSDNNLHIFEYRPESPMSLSGQRLLHKSALHLAHPVQSMTLIPCKGFWPIDARMVPSHQILITHTTGAISLIHPLTEPTYRRLSTLQSYLTTILDQPCALNPRAYRTVDAGAVVYSGAVQESMGPSGARTIVDGQLVGRWRELGVRGRTEAWARVGGYLGGEGETAVGMREVHLLQGGALCSL